MAGSAEFDATARAQPQSEERDSGHWRPFKEFAGAVVGRVTRSHADKQTFRQRRLFEKIVEQQDEKDRLKPGPTTNSQYWFGIACNAAAVAVVVGLLYLAANFFISGLKGVFWWSQMRFILPYLTSGSRELLWCCQALEVQAAGARHCRWGLFAQTVEEPPTPCLEVQWGSQPLRRAGCRRLTDLEGPGAEASDGHALLFFSLQLSWSTLEECLDARRLFSEPFGVLRRAVEYRASFEWFKLATASYRCRFLKKFLYVSSI